MAISGSNVVALTSDSSLGMSITTSSFTTVTGNFYILGSSYNGGGISGVVTAVTTGLGVVWTTIMNGYVSISYGLCTAGATGTLTCTKTPYGDVFYLVDQFSGVAQSGTNVQTANGTVTLAKTASATLSITLSAFGSSNNATYMMAGISSSNVGSSPTSVTADSGFTQLAADSLTYYDLSEFLATSNVAPTVVFGQDNSVGGHSIMNGIAMEIKSAVVVDAYTNTIINSMMLMGGGI